MEQYSQTESLPTDPECKKLLDLAIEKEASDLHLTVGVPPVLRINGKLYPQKDLPVLTGEHSERLIKSFMTKDQQEKFIEKKEFDFSFPYIHHHRGRVRFRANVYLQKGYMAASLRLIPKEIKTLAELNLPPILEKFTLSSQGFCL